SIMNHAVSVFAALAMSIYAWPARAQTSPAQTAPTQGAPAQPAPVQPSTPTTSAADAKPDFSGTWTLDPSISADPSKATFDPTQGRTNQRYGGFGGGRGRGGIGGGRRPTRDTSDDRTPDERARLQALTDAIRKGARTLVISHHEPSFVVNDAQ